MRTSSPSSSSRALALGLALALAGCVFENCPTTDSADFDAPGLFAALATREHTDRAPDAGLPLVDANVTLVEWRDGTRIARLLGGFVEIVVEDDDALREHADAFLSVLSREDVAPWIAALLANKTDLEGYGQSGAPVPAPPGEPGAPGFFYRAEIAGPWRVEGALEKVGGTDDPSSAFPGSARIERDGWAIVLAYVVREARVEGVFFHADGHDRTRASVERDPPDAQKSASSARVDLALGALGLPDAGIPPDRFSTLVC